MKLLKGFLWVPSLYFAEALPYVAVMVISVTMYKRLGLTNAELAFYTSWLYLPWVVKPLWSPFVDAVKTKRCWVLSMQLLIGAGFAGVAFTLHTAFWLQASLAFFWLLAFSSATHDIAADGFYILALDSRGQSFFVGIRSTFYRIATICGQGLLVIFAGRMEKITHDIPLSWALSFYLLAGFFILIMLYHYFALPRAERAACERPLTLRSVSGEFVETLRVFFTKKQVAVALLFMLLFRFPEAQLVKIVNPFMLDDISKGGMGLDTEAVGFIYGTVGVIGLLLGGVLGGILVSVHGLKKWLWPMVLAISLPDAVYIYLSMTQTQDLLLIHSCVFVEQFGYGFGFTAYMMYLIYFARGKNSTSVYAICTAFMALGMMLPGMMAGWLADKMGYTAFFIYVTISCVITAAVSAFLRIDPDFGRKDKK